MIKTFIFGLILGIAGAAALLYTVPAVDLHRESSLISVQPNGGNRESFHINLPQDRIMAGSQKGTTVSTFPDGLSWPNDRALDGSETEIFKLRNDDDAVVGIAARVSSSRDRSGPFVQWMMHLPARGSMFVRMQGSTPQDGRRTGLLVGGTREFESLSGQIKEHFDDQVIDDEFGIRGRLEIVTALVAPLGEAE